MTRHRLALLELLGDAFRDPSRRSVLKTRGISMDPFIQERDEVVIQAVELARIEVGDVIAFRRGEVLFLHRVVGRRAAEGEPVFYEKGDNNLYLTEVAGSSVLGLVTEIAAGRRRLDLRSRAARRLGRVAARYGRIEVRLYELLRAAGRAAGPLRPAAAALRPVAVAGLQLPLRLTLGLARRILPG